MSEFKYHIFGTCPAKGMATCLKTNTPTTVAAAVDRFKILHPDHTPLTVTDNGTGIKTKVATQRKGRRRRRSMQS